MTSHTWHTPGTQASYERNVCQTSSACIPVTNSIQALTELVTRISHSMFFEKSSVFTLRVSNVESVTQHFNV